MMSKFFGGRKRQSSSALRRALAHEPLETRRLLAADTMRAMAADLDGAGVEVGGDLGGFRETMHALLNHFHNRTVDRTIESLEAGIANDDLPGDLTVDDAQGIIDGLTAAVEAGNRDAISELLGQVSAAKRLDSIRAEIAGFQEALDAATAAADGTEVLLYGLPATDVEAALQTANDALASDPVDLDAADSALDVLKDAKRAEALAARNLARYAAKVERLNADLAAAAMADPPAETYHGVPIEEAQMYAADATEAIANGDAAGAKTALDALKAAEQLVRDTARITAKVESLNAELAAAATADPPVLTYKGLDIAVAQGFADDANLALENGDIAGASAALGELNAAVYLAHEVAEVEAAVADLQARLDALAPDDPNAAAIALAIETANGALAAGDLASLEVAEAAIKAVTPSSHDGHGGGHDDGHGGGFKVGRGRGRH